MKEYRLSENDVDVFYVEGDDPEFGISINDNMTKIMCITLDQAKTISQLLSELLIIVD